MGKFDPETLRKLHDCKEVAIRTTKHPGSAVTIWVVVSSTDVFVRSVRGAKGRWYRDLAAGGTATLEFNGEQVAVQAVPTTDALSVERASQEFLSKYPVEPLRGIDCAPRDIGNYIATGPAITPVPTRDQFHHGYGVSVGDGVGSAPNHRLLERLSLRRQTAARSREW